MPNVVVQARYGPMLVNDRDLYVGEAFVHCGEYSEHEVAFLRALIRPDDHVVMCGANIGALVVPIAQRVQRVLAFEPQLYAFQLLNANLALNNLTNVEAFRYAVGSARGVIEVPRLDPTAIANTGGVSVGTGNDAVPMLSIDSMGLLACDVIQADVEGFELAVLKGATQLILRERPVLYLEADRQEQRGALLTWLVEAGYHVWEHTPPLWNGNNWHGNPDERWPNTVSLNWLAMHPEHSRDLPASAHLRPLWPTIDG